jgi:exosortase A-associated hydrolase 2
MTPLYFGSNERRLFGAYAPPRAAGVVARAVVLCYPWGQEYIRAHRSMRQLANMLCAAGYHVLRFDYFGTGDSAGETVEADVRGWERDIETAMEELKDTSGATRVALVGLRIGATLAARVATRKIKEIDGLVLWDPVVSGPEYLEDIFRTAAARTSDGKVAPAAAGQNEILGFPLTHAFADEIRALDLCEAAPAFPARTNVIASQSLHSHGALRAQLDSQGRPGLVIEHIDSPFAWLQHRDLGAGAVPVKVLERIVECLR